MEKEKVKNKRESMADKDLYDIVNSDVKVSKELEEKMNKEAKEFGKRMGWVK